MTFHISSEYQGRTVLWFLRSQLRISSSALAALKWDERGILVNDRHVTVRYILQEHDILFINEADSFKNVSEHIPPVALPLHILFENNDILVADKPAYMPTHPSHGHTNDTLANAVAYLYQSRKLPFVFRPIGRLDRNTSGISLIAKHAIAASFLFYARQKGMIHKKYIAILKGRMTDDGELHTIHTYMKRQEDSIILRCIGEEGEEGSFPAITHWRTLYASDEISVVEAIPETGRTHQLRVHFAYIGHPILGDDVYGEADPAIGRHALHAAYLSIPLPYGEKQIVFTSEPPADMQAAFKKYTGKNLCRIYFENFNQYS